MAVQCAMVVPLAAVQMIFKLRVDHQALIAVINPLACGLTLFAGFLISRQPLQPALPVKRVPLALLGCGVITLLGAVILMSEADNVFRTLLPMPESVLKMFREVFSSGTNPVGSLLVMVVVAHLTEEPLCRGLILYGFLGRYSRRKAVLFSALLFAGLHLNPWQFVSAFSLGCLLGWWFLRTGSLVPCIAGHAFYNGCVFASPYLPFEIPGFNQGDPSAPTGFQPWWLDVAGLVLTVAGVVLFSKLSSGIKPWLPEFPTRVPPLLPAMPSSAAEDQTAPATAEPAPPVISER